MSHELYIDQCFKLAKMAQGQVSPNPMVGCVIIKDNEIISTGYHKGSGQDHAELDAIKNAKVSVEGATLYSNLEPCCHTNKKTPPCAQRIIKEGIKKVIISNLDPNPEVSGSGVKLLEEAGIEVITDILKSEGEKLNEVFFTHITKSRPFVHLKFAQTLDGKLATNTGDSKWITSEKARQDVHMNRNLYDAILIGGNTLNRDNPKLTVRINGNEISKKRVVLTNTDIDHKNLNLYCDNFKDQTITINYDQNLDLEDTLTTLYKEYGIRSLYVEGGAKTISRFLEKELFDKVSIYIAPKILGKGSHILTDRAVDFINQAIKFKDSSWKVIDKDVVLTAYKKD